MLLIPEIRRLKREDFCKSQVSQCCLVRPSLTRTPSVSVPCLMPVEGVGAETVVPDSDGGLSSF